MPPSGYLSSSGIESSLVYLANKYPNLCQLIMLPEASAEGRSMRALKLGKRSEEHRHGVLLVSGLHARELVNPDAMVSLGFKLCQAYTSETDLSFGGKTFGALWIKVLLDLLDIYIFPLVNPDGRSYVQSPTGNPWWRKNRRPIPGSQCAGVDLNRNFDFLWSSGIGTSADPCNNQTFKGTAPFSETETRNVRWLLEQHPIKCFMDVHSYSELILYPWGDDVNQTMDDGMTFQNPAYDGLRGNALDMIYQEYIPVADQYWYVQIGKHIRDAIGAVRGRWYQLEQSVGLYPTSGTSDDYAYSRFFANSRTRKVRGYTLETGTEFQPAFPEALNVMAEAMAGALEFCSACLCVVEEISHGHRLVEHLEALRHLRDEVLLSYPAGRRYVALLEKHTLELLVRVGHDMRLLEQSQELLEQVAQVVLENRAFDQELITKVQAAFEGFAEGASAAFSDSLKELSADLEQFRDRTLVEGLEKVQREETRPARAKPRSRKGKKDVE